MWLQGSDRLIRYNTSLPVDTQLWGRSCAGVTQCIAERSGEYLKSRASGRSGQVHATVQWLCSIGMIDEEDGRFLHQSTMTCTYQVARQNWKKNQIFIVCIS